MATDTQGWQPIETAPKNGTYILGYQKHGWPEIVVMDWDESSVYATSKSWCYTPSMDDYNSRETLDPTHWMPLPDPPAEEGRPSNAEAGADGQPESVGAQGSSSSDGREEP